MFPLTPPLCQHKKLTYICNSLKVLFLFASNHFLKSIYRLSWSYVQFIMSEICPQDLHMWLPTARYLRRKRPLWQLLFLARLVLQRDLPTQRKSGLLWYNIFNLFSVFLLCSSKFLHINMKMHPLSLPSLRSWPCKNQNTELELLCSESEHTVELLKTPLKSVCAHGDISQNLLCVNFAHWDRKSTDIASDFLLLLTGAWYTNFCSPQLKT